MEFQYLFTTYTLYLDTYKRLSVRKGFANCTVVYVYLSYTKKIIKMSREVIIIPELVLFVVLWNPFTFLLL